MWKSGTDEKRVRRGKQKEYGVTISEKEGYKDISSALNTLFSPYAFCSFLKILNREIKFSSYNLF